MLIRLAMASLWSRRLTVGLTVLAVALSAALYMGVEKVSTGARTSFSDTISNTDLIVGARSGAVQLLLYSVFRVGSATNNISWESYLDIAARPEVDWMVPISLGDSHQGYRVMGTSQDYFERFMYRGDRSLAFADGRRFEDLFDVVLGADVARDLGYVLGERITVSHGVQSFLDHDDMPFEVVGLLGKTGTPVDRTVFVSLEAIEAIHVDWQSGVRIPGQSTQPQEVREMDLTPLSITAAFVGVNSPLEVFSLQRLINAYPAEPLLAILPGVALQELWQIVGVAETALMAVSFMVITTALLGMVAMIFASLNERRREMAILRAMGAPPWAIVGLLMIEAIFIAMLAAVVGLVLLYLALAVARPWVDAGFGIFLPITPPTLNESLVLVALVVAGGLVSLFPAIRAYRLSIADGMTILV